jgi:hypothetical protein
MNWSTDARQWLRDGQVLGREEASNPNLLESPPPAGHVCQIELMYI